METISRIWPGTKPTWESTEPKSAATAAAHPPGEQGSCGKRWWNELRYPAVLPSAMAAGRDQLGGETT